MIAIGMLVYPQAANWISRIGQNSQISGYIEQVGNTPSEARARILDAAYRYNDQLGPGPLTAIVPGAECILDGGHNADAARVIAVELADRPVLNVVIGMLANRRVEDFLGPLAPFIDRLWAIPVSGHDHHSPADICAAAQALGIRAAYPAGDVRAALEDVSATLARESDDRHQTVLITGSLYLAGKVLALNGEIPE